MQSSGHSKTGAMMEFGEYSRNHHQFIAPLPSILDEFLNKNPQIESIADIGCGDGAVLFSIKEKKPAAKLTGIDLSPERLGRLNERDKSIKTFVADACDLKALHGADQDLAISSQVIEHVPSDEKMLQEIAEIVKPGGSLYVSSVIKRWYGWWIYTCNGKVTCDPTHVREYASKQEFCNLIESNGFKVLECKTTPFLPSVLNFIMRIMIRSKLLNYNSIDGSIQRHPKLFAFLQKIFRVWAPGYFIVEVIAVRSK
jgi:ubiquinone/menaquinone biosynthesis C-methylase UbiE